MSPPIPTLSIFPELDIVTEELSVLHPEPVLYAAVAEFPVTLKVSRTRYQVFAEYPAKSVTVVVPTSIRLPAAFKRIAARAPTEERIVNEFSPELFTVFLSATYNTPLSDMVEERDRV